MPRILRFMPKRLRAKASMLLFNARVTKARREMIPLRRFRRVGYQQHRLDDPWMDRLPNHT
jgi:hypothetical protein